LREYAKYAKHNLLEIFQEKISGATKGKDRIEFNRMLEFIDSNKVHTVLVWELSRIGRKMIDVLNNIDDLTKKGINIYIKKEGINTLDENGNKSLMANIVISVLSGFAEMERDTTQKRIVSGLQNAVANGGSGSSLLKPYGYANVNRKLVIDPVESETVQLIFQKYLEGLGTLQIAGLLNKMKVPTRYNKAYGDKVVKSRTGLKKKGSDYVWRDGTIYSILNNTIYYGARNYNDEVYEAPAIITKKTFDLVQARLKNNFNKASSDKKYDNILTGLLKCPTCGKNYFMHKRADNSDNAYKCISIRYGERCGNPSVNIDKLNNSLFWMCQPYIYNDSVQGGKDSLKVSIDNKQIELDNVNGLIEKAKVKLKNDLKYLREGLISQKDFKEYKLETETTIIKLEDKFLKITAEHDGLVKLSQKKLKDGYTYEMFKKYLPDAVEHVRVHPVVKSERFKDMYGASNDVPVIVEIKTKLVTTDSEPINKYYALTRYSMNIASIQFDKDEDKIKDHIEEIYKGRVRPDVDAILTLDDLLKHPAKYFKIESFKKKKS